MKGAGRDSPAELSRRVEVVISEILAWGVLASLALLGTGTLLSFLGSHDYGAGRGTSADLARLVRPGAAFPRSARWLVPAVAHGNGQAIIVAGLVLLIATPVVRVAVSVLAFALEGDRRYTIITTIVLLLLLLSLALGKGG
jgi:uncharacterized membrane protein